MLSIFLEGAAMKKLCSLALGLGLAAAFFTACSVGDNEQPPVYKYYGYVTNRGGMDRDGDPLPPGKISAFTIDRGSGGFTVLAGSPFPGVWQSLAVAAHPSGRFIYVTSKERPWDYNEYWISVLTIDPATGALTRTADRIQGAGYSPTSAAVHPSGKFIYVTDKQSYGGGGDSQVSGFTIDEATGELTRMAGSPVEVEYAIGSVVVDPSGKFAYVTHGNDDCISAFTIDPATGALTAMVGSPFAAGDGPGDIAISPSGTFAYVGNVGSDSISVFMIDGATGALAEMPGSPFATQGRPRYIAVHPSGKFVYAMNVISNSISAFSINPVTGALAAVAGSPFATREYPHHLEICPSGRFAYVPGVGRISVFGIDPVMGALAEVSGSPFLVGQTTDHLAVVRIAQ